MTYRICDVQSRDVTLSYSKYFAYREIWSAEQTFEIVMYRVYDMKGELVKAVRQTS